MICKRNHAFVYKQSILLDFNYGNRRYVDRIIDTLIEQLLLRGTGPGQWGVLEDGRVPALGWWRPPPGASHLFWLMISRESQGSDRDLFQLIAWFCWESFFCRKINRITGGSGWWGGPIKMVHFKNLNIMGNEGKKFITWVVEFISFEGKTCWFCFFPVRSRDLDSFPL